MLHRLNLKLQIIVSYSLIDMWRNRPTVKSKRPQSGLGFEKSSQSPKHILHLWSVSGGIRVMQTFTPIYHITLLFSTGGVNAITSKLTMATVQVEPCTAYRIHA